MSHRTDDMNIELLKLLSELRNHIDVTRIIGLNVDQLENSTISSALLGYLQKSTLELLAIWFCKIFEDSKRNKLNSIPGIIDSLSPIHLSQEQIADFAAFGKRHGNHTPPTEAKSFLRSTFGIFAHVHSQSLARLKEFRDTVGAHSDAKASKRALPSHAEFEALWNFANEFYELVSRFIRPDVVPVQVMPRMVGRGLLRLFESNGVVSPKFDFEDETLPNTAGAVL